MQKITSYKRIDERAKLNVFGSELYLVTPTDITEDSTNQPSESKLHSFKDGIVPPCALFGYDTTDANGHEESKIVSSLHQLAVDVFKFDPSTENGLASIKMLTNYVYDVSAQLRLEVIELENGMVIVSSVLHNIAKHEDKTWEDIQKMSSSNRDIQLAMGNLGPATLLGEIVKFGSRVYDKFNYDEKVTYITECIRGMTKVAPDGNACSLSMADVEDLFSNVKARLYLR